MDSFNKVLKNYRRAFFNTFWFVPALISLLGPLLAFLFLRIDTNLSVVQEHFIFQGGTAEANTILSTIAGSLITVAGLAFSITIVVLQLVSSQYTPRALRGFLQDRVTQVIAGGFFAIFAYAMVVLAAMREPSTVAHGFLPSLSIIVAIGLSFLGLAFLLIFVHHTGRIIQVSDIAAHIAMQTLQTIEHPFPEWDDDEHTEETTSDRIQTWLTEEEPARIRAKRPGYVQRIELTSLMQYLLRPGFHLHLLVCPGDFVTEETIIAELRPMHMADANCMRAIHDHIAIERERDIAQDARFGVRQLADIALRALSPAINDPTTGVLCIKYLQAVFERLVQHLPQPETYRFLSGTSSLDIRQPTFEEYLEVFAEIGHYAGGNLRVINTLLTTLDHITEIATFLKMEERQDLLFAQRAALASLDTTAYPSQSNGAPPKIM
ncbi:DUF2254 domain-containing protein [Ktedonobacteria bacterium brp13]|nr:DUF2254 domain-containing protein [Ktedonobacteria bacterium brp13]